jgi:hypothetical protein
MEIFKYLITKDKLFLTFFFFLVKKKNFLFKNEIKNFNLVFVKYIFFFFSLVVDDAWDIFYSKAH